MTPAYPLVHHLRMAQHDYVVKNDWLDAKTEEPIVGRLVTDLEPLSCISKFLPAAC